MSIPALIELKNIIKDFSLGNESVRILKNINLTIYEGEFLALMGPSGSGKSTLMNILGCLDNPTSGTYLLKGEDVTAFSREQRAIVRRNSFGFIFQRYNLINGMNAVENVEVPAIYAGLNKRERILRAKDFLSSLGLNERLDYKPSQLSGGQQQRVSIARALMNGARIVVADEPTGALDSSSGEEVMNILHKLHREGNTVIMVTHDSNIAANAERIIRIKDGEIQEDSSVMPERKSEKILSGQVQDKSSFLTETIEASKMAFRSLRINKFRSILTMLGIIIGVGSVVAMLAIGTGAKQEVLSRIEAMGSNLIIVKPGAPNVRAGGDIATLTLADAEAIKQLPNVVGAVPEIIGPATVRFGNTDYLTTIDATSPKFSEARNWQTVSGVYFDGTQNNSYAPVAVIGKTVANILFPNTADPIGQYILIGSVPFQVVGVMSAKGADSQGNDMDDVVFVPINTGSMRLFGRTYLKTVTVQVSDANQMDATQDAINDLLLKRHHNVEDFQIRNMASILQTATETQNTLTYLLGAIATISLIVGGIGVMNIMLVSVTERTREIGIRMAVGAKSKDVMVQFIIESLVVSLIGGIIGIATGVGGGILTSVTMNWLAIFSVDSIAIAFFFSFSIGLVFGYLPARRASSLDPVIALAAE
ncbi:MAG TPA: macrolide ABC transporter permease/ATP-binding protein MacB [Ignavibacteriales bacterium]|nr:MAG: macrolide ABC transporter permease/ATP-binding protein MacB [Ignavibacteria bacterium GWB2_35_6b]OGU52591.1 MAG: macrolide ABC transporter permease/ATP-binding protein MacB [Ignavibacteria bacterium GWC2_36_12]HCY76116.1 macrolide ABC transporter permease/ATP-binding protein MacB [Ignavibacteriales bacterium]